MTGDAGRRGAPGREIFVVVPHDAEVADVVDLGHRPPAERVCELAAAGRRVMVRWPAARAAHSSPAHDLAEVAVYAWLGARVFATADPGATRQALDMVASVLGVRPPSVARRGLA
jgi:hypothetical protein